MNAAAGRPAARAQRPARAARTSNHGGPSLITRNAPRRLLPLCLIGALVVALAAACGNASTGTKTPTPTSPSASATTSTDATPSNGSPTTSTSGGATPAGAVSQAVQIAAEQTLITYYTALNNQDYPSAYALWADNGT